MVLQVGTLNDLDPNWSVDQIRKHTLSKTRMVLQLVDGNLEEAMGHLQNIICTSCGVQYKHTFSLWIFEKDLKYKDILGRSFMHHMQMFKDWGYRQLYLQHDHVITKVKLRHHFYREVTYSPMEEFDSASFKLTKSVGEKSNAQTHMYIYEALLQGPPIDRVVEVKGYIL